MAGPDVRLQGSTLSEGAKGAVIDRCPATGVEGNPKRRQWQDAINPFSRLAGSVFGVSYDASGRNSGLPLRQYGEYCLVKRTITDNKKVYLACEIQSLLKVTHMILRARNLVVRSERHRDSRVVPHTGSAAGRGAVPIPVHILGNG